MKKKFLFATLFTAIVMLLSVSVSAKQIKFEKFPSDSTYKPVSYSSHKSLSTVTLYGNADLLCMKAYKDSDDNEKFRLEIYSDSKRIKKVAEYTGTYKKGTKYDDIFFDLTGFKSKTYYATSYVIKKSNTGFMEYEKDPDTITKFKVVIKRDGTKLKNMKTIMYGYENSPSGPVIYWYSVPGATKYYIYKKKDGKYKKIKTVKAVGGELSYYIDDSLKDKNATAYYKVKAVNGTGKTPLSEDRVKVKAVKSPKVTLESCADGSVKISWSKVSDDAVYRIYMAKGSSDWQYVGKTYDRSYVYDSKMESGTVYFFTVVAVNSKGTSGYEDNKYIIYIENPTIKSATEVSGNLVVSWDAVRGAESYNVYRRAKGTEEWTKIGNTKDSSFTDYSVSKNSLYDYTVRSVRGSKECINKTYRRTAGILGVPVINSVKTDSQGNPVISWNKISNFSYRVWRKAEDENDWRLIGNTTATSFTDEKDLVNGKRYSYAVSAYVNNIYGETSDATETFNVYLPIKSQRPSSFEEGIRISWEKVENVEGYNVYRKTGDEPYTLLAKTDTTFFDDKTVLKDVAYTYKIVCIIDGDEKSITTAEIPAKLSSQYVTALLETVNYGDDICYIKPSGFNSETKYTVYIKVNGVWSVVKEQYVSRDYLAFKKNEGSLVNEYSIASVSADGTITTAGDENAFKLSYIVPTRLISIKPDHNEGTATLTWKPVVGAEKYIIYSGGTKIAVVDKAKTSYTTGKLETGRNISFSVGVVRGSTEYISNSSFVYIIKKPTVTATVDTDGLHIRWDGSYGENYTVYRKNSADGEWRALKDVKVLHYDDASAEHGKTYYYTVATKEGVKDEKGIKVTFIIKPLKIRDVSLGKKTVTLKWRKSSVADYYIVYKKVNGKWKEVYTTKTAKTVKYTDKNVKAGKKYSYRICAVKDGVKGEYTTTSVVFISAPSKLKATAVSNGVKLTFNEVKDAKKYVVYRKSGNGKYERIKTLKKSATSYTDKNVKKGVKYTYYVKAYNGSQYSKASSKVSYKK